MATTDKSISLQNLNEQNDTSTSSKTQDLEKNYSEALSLLVTNKAYRAEEKDVPQRVVFFRFLHIEYYDGEPYIRGITATRNTKCVLYPKSWDIYALSGLEEELL